MATAARWFAPALAAALGAAALMPAPANAQSADLVRTIVDIADVAFRNNQPYYRGGDYGTADRLVASRDRYGRTVYYRVADTRYDRRAPYGYSAGSDVRRAKCNKNGKCKVEYYDARQDQRRYRGW